MIRPFMDFNDTCCEKCDHKNSYVVYYCNLTKKRYGDLCDDFRIICEHLHVHCRECHYEFLMECADYKVGDDNV